MTKSLWYLLSVLLGPPVFHLTGTASPVNSGTSDRGACGRTADPVSIIAVVCLVRAALVGVWAVVVHAIMPVIAVIRAIDGIYLSSSLDDILVQS